MPRDPNKPPARRKAERATEVAPQSASWLQQSADWPVYEVLVSRDRASDRELVTILVARRSPRSGKIAAASFLVDLACLGVKSAFVRICKSPADYDERMRSRVLELQPMQPASLDLAAKIVQAGIEYAQSLGFNPDPEYQQASLLLNGADIEHCPDPVEVGGPDGKPLYVAGPNDNVERIMNHLLRTRGPDGFHYVLQAGDDFADEL